MGAQEKAAHPTACHPDVPSELPYADLYEKRPYLNIQEWSVNDVNGDLTVRSVRFTYKGKDYTEYRVPGKGKQNADQRG